MAEDTPLRVVLEQDASPGAGGYAFRIHFDEAGLAPLLGDEPAPLGMGQGPNPAQLLLASLANCLASSLLFALRKYKNTPGALRAEIVADKVRNADGRWRIPKASVTLRLADPPEDLQHLERALDQFEQFCIVTQSVREGIEVEVHVTDAQGRPLGAGELHA